MEGRVVAIEGPSAAGKTRVVRELAPRLGAAPIAEAYDRLRPRAALVWRTPGELLRLERRLLREDAQRFREARELRTAGALVLADTGFLGSLTYTGALVHGGEAPKRVLTALLTQARGLSASGQWGSPDAIVFLRTPAATRHRRAGRDPVGHPRELQPRHQRIGQEELRFYREVVAPAYAERFRFVDGEGPPGAVDARVRRAVRDLRQRPATQVPVEALLRGLLTLSPVP